MRQCDNSRNNNEGRTQRTKSSLRVGQQNISNILWKNFIIFALVVIVFLMKYAKCNFELKSSTYNRRTKTEVAHLHSDNSTCNHSTASHRDSRLISYKKNFHLRFKRQPMMWRWSKEGNVKRAYIFHRWHLSLSIVVDMHGGAVY